VALANLGVRARSVYRCMPSREKRMRHWSQLEADGRISQMRRRARFDDLPPAGEEDRRARLRAMVERLVLPELLGRLDDGDFGAAVEEERRYG